MLEADLYLLNEVNTLMEPTPYDKYGKISVGKILTAAGAGTFVDFYEFYVSSTAAAVVWPIIFFGPLTSSKSFALILSFLTFTVSYLARPIGAFVFGHIGDKMGRTSTLGLALIITFIAVLGTGLLPTYAQIGILAVALLILFRFMLGISLGGEWGGATSWVLEYAEFKGHSHKRAFYGGLLDLAIPLGVGAGGVAFALSAAYTGSSFLTFGWRIPYLAGAVIAIIGAIIRFRMLDSPLFKKVQAEKQIARIPAAEVFRGKRALITLGAAEIYAYALVVNVLVGGPIAILYLSQAKLTGTLGLPPAAFPAFAIGLANILAAVGCVIGGILGDKIGRKYAILISLGLVLALYYPYVLAMASLNPIAIIAGSAIIILVDVMGTGLVASWLPELFETRFRYSGAGLAGEIGGLIGGLIVGLVSPALIANASGINIVFMGIFLVGVIYCVITIFITLLMPETRGKKLE
ncbi:MFS transporter [Sulfolobus tengchongensis]|uniref:MFS transporter n=1 Tax=Sulfolobus tengchongensis TaxID=207809 RepID=A0AAX4L2C0_9CREN